MKLAFVVPRYGDEVIGGAETGARQLAEHLVSILGWEVEILTTTALEAATWAPHYPAGTTIRNDVTVRRFPVDSGRRADFAARSNDYFASPRAHDRAAQLQWVTDQGPVSHELLDALAGTDADRIAFYPYLYHPTVVGLPIVADRSILHGAAHAESPIHIPLVGDVFRAARALVFHSDAERRLVTELFPETAPRPQIVLGLGVERGVSDPEAAKEVLGERSDDPYLLCLGRVDPGKGVDALVGYFSAYKSRRRGPLTLVVAGPVGTAPPPHPDVIVTGPVDEAAKWGLLEGCLTLVSPSPNESFSLVLLEAWLAGRPVLANRWCEPTRDHCLESRGGVTFADLADLTAALDLLLERPEVATAMAAAGERYVLDRYAWPALVARYDAFVGSLART